MDLVRLCSAMVVLNPLHHLSLLQSMQWAVGLRGAMAYGLVVHLPTLKHGLERQGNPAIETATLFIVCTSTLILGGGTTWLLKVFKLDVRLPLLQPFQRCSQPRWSYCITLSRMQPHLPRSSRGRMIRGVRSCF